ncbi:MAG: dienelactone hydrolase family protein [Pseudobdellovibrio sp.]|nr:dienelactone hydrolase family protein [Pseudobdellovibrio sp.]
MLFKEIEIPIANESVKGDLTVFAKMKAVIIFAHGSDSSRKSPRNQAVAQYLNENGFGTLLFDLLTPEEAKDRKNVFNIELLADRLVVATRFLRKLSEVREEVRFGYFGASTGAGAAIKAADLISVEEEIYAVVSRGGRPDLAGDSLNTLKTPTLLIVGGNDAGVIELNELAEEKLKNCILVIIPGATHLFIEPGTMEQVSKKALEWFEQQLPEALYQFPEMSV